MKILLILTTALLLQADMFSPSHSCYKPTKPYQFNSQWEVDSYNNDVETYKNCIQDFIDEQNNAIRVHNQAASDAIDEWNSFASYGY